METRSTIVIKLPEQLTGKAVRAAMRQIKPALRLDHPQVIVDMANVRQLDSAALDMLLYCIVEVSKRDGELKLAAISPEAATFLELTRMDRVFDIFPSVSEAVTENDLSQLQILAVSNDLAQQPAAA